MKKLDLEFNQKPGLSLALDMLKALPAEATLQQAIVAVANANGAIFDQMPIMVITTQRAMSPAIRQAADEFKIPVYYRNRDDVRHHGVLPLTGLSSDVKQTIYSRSDFTPEAETVVDYVKIFEGLEFQARPLRNQDNAWLILMSAVSHNPKVQMLLKMYGYQALRLEVAQKSKWLVGVPEIQALTAIGIDTRLPVPTDDELELFLQGQLQPQKFTMQWDREMALKETKKD